MIPSQNNLTIPSVRLWCIAARVAPIVAVFARCYNYQGWSCLLRWKWESEDSDQLLEGAWTTLNIDVRSCELSPDGEFICYHARGPNHGPFSGSFGGARAISRLPWISALTNIENVHPMNQGEYLTRDALSPQSQQVLRAIFNSSKLTCLSERSWSNSLGPGWIPIPREDISKDHRCQQLSLDKPPHHAAYVPIPDTQLHLLAVVNTYAKNGRPRTWSPWLGNLKYFIVSAHATSSGDVRGQPTTSLAPYQLTDVIWANPARGARLLVATTDAKLRILRLPFDQSVPAPAPLQIDVKKLTKPKWPKVEQEHDLAHLKANPGPAPQWAKEELGNPRFKPR